MTLFKVRIDVNGDGTIITKLREFLLMHSHQSTISAAVEMECIQRVCLFFISICFPNSSPVLFKTCRVLLCAYFFPPFINLGFFITLFKFCLLRMRLYFNLLSCHRLLDALTLWVVQVEEKKKSAATSGDLRVGCMKLHMCDMPIFFFIGTLTLFFEL